MLRVVESNSTYDYDLVGFVAAPGQGEPHDIKLILLYPLFDRQNGVFTPICSSEIPAIEQIRTQFEALHCTVLHATFDTVEVQQRYIKAKLDKQYRKKVLFLSVSKKYRNTLFPKSLFGGSDVETRSWVLLHNGKAVAFGTNPANVARSPQALLSLVSGYVNYEVKGEKCLVEDLT